MISSSMGLGRWQEVQKSLRHCSFVSVYLKGPVMSYSKLFVIAMCASLLEITGIGTNSVSCVALASETSVSIPNYPARNSKDYPVPSPVAKKNIDTESFPIPDTKVLPGYKAPERKLEQTQSDLYVSALLARAYSNWEPSHLQKRVTRVSFNVAEDGSFHNIKVIEPSGDMQTDFACVEAVSESSKFLSEIPTAVKNSAGIVLSFQPSKKKVFFDCATNITHANTESPTKAKVIWHLIPLEALNCIPELSPTRIHSDQNIRVITLNSSNETALSGARTDWVEFLRSRPRISITELEDEAKLIDRKYAYLFVKRGVETQPSLRF
jgi:hypothetical protein